MGLAGVTLALALTGARAEACSPPLACAGTELFPLGETVPANVAGVEWWWAWWDRATPDLGGLRMERYDDAAMAWQAVDFDVATDGPRERVTLRPRAPLAPSARYRVTAGSACAAPVPTPWREFRTAAAAPLPTTLGTLQALPATSANIPHGGFQPGICAYSARATTVEVTLAPSAEATPWAAMLVYEVRVDGAPFVGLVEYGSPMVRPAPGATHHGRGRARLAVICGPSTDPYHAGHPFDRTQGLSEGEHTVVFRARVAGTETVLETAPLTVYLPCLPTTALTDASLPPVDATAPGSDGAVATDATLAPRDVTAAPGDVAAPAQDAPPPSSAPRAVESSGCSASRGPRGGSGALVGVAAILGVLRRRRARRR